MLKIPENSMQRAKIISQLCKDKRSQIYFLLRYGGPAAILALPAIVHISDFNLSTLDGALEVRVFVISMLLVGVAIYKKVKAIEIHETMRTDHLGHRLPDNIHRLIYMLFFSGLASIILVWCTLNINKIFDESQPREIIGEIESNDIGSRLFFGTSYELRISPTPPNIKKFRFNINEHLYADMSIGEKVIFIVKDGVFGYPYVAEVKPYKANRNMGFNPSAIVK